MRTIPIGGETHRQLRSMVEFYGYEEVVRVLGTLRPLETPDDEVGETNG